MILFPVRLSLSMSVCLSLKSQCISTPVQLPQGQRVCLCNFLAVGEYAVKVRLRCVCAPWVCLHVCVYTIMCTHVCTITYCLRRKWVQSRLPLRGVFGACRWERNKSNIDCRAALPPAGDPQTCRPGSKCFSPPKLTWEEQERPSYTPQRWVCLRPNDGAGVRLTHIHMHTQWQNCECVHVHTKIHTHTHNHSQIDITPVTLLHQSNTHLDEKTTQI